MKVEKTIYIINGKLLNSIPEYYEGQYIDIELEIEFTTDTEECHGKHNICTWEYTIQSIYVMNLENGSKKLICDITESFEDIIFELIQERKVLI